MNIRTWDDLNAAQKRLIERAYVAKGHSIKLSDKNKTVNSLRGFFKVGYGNSRGMWWELTTIGCELYERAHDTSKYVIPASLKEDEGWLAYVESKHSAEKPFQIVLTENMNQMHQAGIEVWEENIRLRAENECYQAMKEGVQIRIADLEKENERLRAELDAAKHELEARRSILEMAVNLKMELLPARAGNGWIDSIEQLGQMARDERERADTYLKQIADIRDAMLKPQDALAGEWLAATVSSPSSVVDLVKARMEQVEKMRETLKDIADGTRGIPPSNYQESTRFWQSRHNLLVGIAQDALQELDKAK